MRFAPASIIAIAALFTVGCGGDKLTSEKVVQEGKYQENLYVKSHDELGQLNRSLGDHVAQPEAGSRQRHHPDDDTGHHCAGYGFQVSPSLGLNWSSSESGASRKSALAPMVRQICSGLGALW